MSKENIFFPNTTQVPNFVFDVLMAKCASHPARLFILLAIIRKTYGWQKHEDLLSLSQIIALTGMSKNAVKDALKFWQKEKVIKLLSKGDGRKISKYRCLLYDYIDTKGVIEKHPGGQPDTPTESVNDTYRGQSVTPQNQLNQLTKNNIQNTPTLSEQLKELAEKNGLTYSINTREQNLFHNKLSMEMGLTNDKILEQANRFFEIVKRDQKQTWIHSFSFSFKFLQFNWDKIDAWHNANKSNVVKFIHPTEKKAPAKFSDNDLDSLKEFLA